MIGLIAAILIFNLIALKIKKRLTRLQMVQIWLFSALFQLMFDVFISLKLHGYWYFSEGVDWQSIPAYLFLTPTANIVFLNFFPFNSKMMKQILYITGYALFCLVYELVTLLPDPWGFFHYGWWNIWLSAALNPILILILLGYFKWMCQLNHESLAQAEKFH